jgi:hypothetical protein
MLTLLGPAHRYCDGLSRRSFLRVGALGFGGLGFGGLNVAQLLAAEANAGNGSSHKSVIMVYLSGGIAHQDTVDLKPDAPQEVRGEFKPIATRVPGIQFCELLPRLGAAADKLAILRSIVGLRDEHTSWQNLTGYPMGLAQREGRPNIGGVVAKALGPADPIVPPAVDLFPTMQHRPYNSGGAGVLGRRYDPVKAEGDKLGVMKLSSLTSGRLDERRALLDSLNGPRTASGADSAGFDVAQQRAYEVLTSGKVVAALDVEREDKRVRERYGQGSPKLRTVSGTRTARISVRCENDCRCSTRVSRRWSRTCTSAGSIAT